MWSSEADLDRGRWATTVADVAKHRLPGGAGRLSQPTDERLCEHRTGLTVIWPWDQQLRLRATEGNVNSGFSDHATRSVADAWMKSSPRAVQTVRPGVMHVSVEQLAGSPGCKPGPKGVEVRILSGARIRR